MMDPKPVLTCFTSFVQTKTTYFEGLFDFSCLNQDVPLLSFFLGDAQGIKAAQNDSKIISEHAFSAPKVVRNLFFFGGGVVCCFGPVVGQCLFLLGHHAVQHNTRACWFSGNVLRESGFGPSSPRHGFFLIYSPHNGLCGGGTAPRPPPPPSTTPHRVIGVYT